MKKVRLIMAVAVLLAITSMTALAGEWKQDSPGWWWQKDDGSYPANQWQWIDGNNDGIAECYYFDTNGYMLFNTTTPDGYEVNSNGNWVVGGIIQTQSKGVNKSIETGYIKQEYIDVLGKNRDYVISQFGDPEVKSFSTYNINGIISESEDFYYKKETGDELNISFHNNEVGRVFSVK
ncbi:hypothetical protein [Lacrimispora indolis]|uniref:hypothetical protein n=1 Tax=Lacrimispora indolis TaxID=69825 RepID=UPI0004625833|nr:hypothetical protein [[Clostridium] methoxybenzovorans]